MRIRWTPAAAADFESISDYLKEHHPRYRDSTLRKLYRTIRALKEWPGRGRPGREGGAREILFPPTPYETNAEASRYRRQWTSHGRKLRAGPTGARERGRARFARRELPPSAPAEVGSGQAAGHVGDGVGALSAFVKPAMKFQSPSRGRSTRRESTEFLTRPTS